MGNGRKSADSTLNRWIQIARDRLDRRPAKVAAVVALAVFCAGTGLDGASNDGPGVETGDSITTADSTRLFSSAVDWKYLCWSNLDCLIDGPYYLVRTDPAHEYQQVTRVRAPGSRIRSPDDARDYAMRQAITFVTIPGIEALVCESAPIESDSWKALEAEVRKAAHVREYCVGNNFDYSTYPLESVKITCVRKIEDYSFLPFEHMLLDEAVAAIHEDLFERIYNIVGLENVLLRSEYPVIKEGNKWDADLATYIIVPKANGIADVYIIGITASTTH